MYLHSNSTQILALKKTFFFSLFQGQKEIIFFFENIVASALKSCIIPFLQFFFFIFWSQKSEKNVFFRAKIWVEFECKYMKVGTRHLFSYLWFYTIFLENIRENAWFYVP